MAVVLVLGVLGVLAGMWRRLLLADKRFLGPLLVTVILVVGDAGFSILLNPSSKWLEWATGGLITSYSPTFVAILVCIGTELALGRFFWGKWPHLASAYISGISAGILVKSPELWPFLLVGVLAIASKYVLRIHGRHLWNPTNFAITVLLFLAPQSVATLSVEAGNTMWAAGVIWILGGVILYRLGLLHISLAFVLAFIPLGFLRASFTGQPWQTELAMVPSPMFQLYTFFMITDPKTITKRWWSQMLVVVLVACLETVLRLVFKDVNSWYMTRFGVELSTALPLFVALFTLGPASNLIEIALTRAKKPMPAVGKAV
jgi:hypothetical protein